MTAVTASDGIWQSSRSARQLRYVLWQPPMETRALLVAIHGFGEHGGRYQEVGSLLAQQGICVAIPDLMGHGRSSGKRGDIRDVQTCIEDLETMTESVFMPATEQNQYAIFGHSFGGLAAIAWALKNPRYLKRAVIQSPLLEVGFSIPVWKKAAAELLGFFCSSCSLSMNLDPAHLSHNPAVVQAYGSDPLVHNKMSARSYYSIQKTRDTINAEVCDYRVPSLLLYGSADKIVSIQAAQQWFDRLHCEKRCVVFPDCYHELHNESVRPDVIREIVDWVLKGCP